MSSMEIHYGLHLQLAIATQPLQGLFIIGLYLGYMYLQLLTTVICQLQQVKWQDQ